MISLSITFGSSTSQPNGFALPASIHKSFFDNLDRIYISIIDFAKANNKVIQSRTGINRKAAPTKPLNDRSWANIFEAKPNEPFIIDIEGGFAIAWVTKSTLPETVNTASKEYQDFQSGLLKATQNEAMMMYSEDKRREYGAKVNQRLIEQTYGQVNEPN